MTFLPNTELKEARNKLSYKLSTKEGPSAHLKLNGMEGNSKKNVVKFRIGDKGRNLNGGRQIAIEFSINDQGWIKKTMLIGNSNGKGTFHGFARMIKNPGTKDASFCDTSIFKGAQTKF